MCSLQILCLDSGGNNSVVKFGITPIIHNTDFFEVLNKKVHCKQLLQDTCANVRKYMK